MCKVPIKLKCIFCALSTVLLLIVMIQAQESEEPKKIYQNNSINIEGMSNTIVYLTSEIYKLSNEPLITANVMNFSLIGNSSGPTSCPTINCSRNGKSFLSIVNSSSITIENIRLMDCDALTENVLAENIIPKKTIAATLYLYNVSLISIKNVMFLESYSHAIVGVNTMDITLVNVNVSRSSSANVFNGGVLLFYNTVYGIRNRM